MCGYARALVRLGKGHRFAVHCVSITTYIKNLDLCIQTRLGLEVRGAADHFLVIRSHLRSLG
jgi:hypothetical protein